MLCCHFSSHFYVLLMAIAFKHSKHEKIDALRNKEKVLWLPVVPRQTKHLAIALLGPAQALAEITEGSKETRGVAVGLHPF